MFALAMNIIKLSQTTILTNNWTIALRFTKIENIHLDLYHTNSLNFIDTGQMQKSDNNSYGINIGFIY